jgi:very-short-patch-repair endonuclease
MAGQGCPKCNESKGEQQIAKYLDDYKINFVRQKKYDECKNKICLPFDFYLTDFNILIEYDGIGHFSPIEAFGGVNAFEYRQRNDTIKNKFVQDNNIKLLRIKYNEKINKKLDELIDFIKNNIT